jgi:hypothetical protein
LSGQTRDRGLLTQGLENLREVTFDTDNDLGGFEKLGDHGDSS